MKIDTSKTTLARKEQEISDEKRKKKYKKLIEQNKKNFEKYIETKEYDKGNLVNILL